MPSKKINIGYITNLQSSFIKIDEELLRERYDVHTLYIPSRSPRFLKDTWNTVLNADVIVAWFASWHSLPAFILGRLLNKKCILITGGYDVANEPEISYGLRQGVGLSYVISSGVFYLSNFALPFSDIAYQEALQNTPLTDKKTRVIRLGVPNIKNILLWQLKKI